MQEEYGGADKLVIESQDQPVPDKGQLLVSVKAAGINFPDVLCIAGTYQVKTTINLSGAWRVLGACAVLAGTMGISAPAFSANCRD